MIMRNTWIGWHVWPFNQDFQISLKKNLTTTYETNSRLVNNTVGESDIFAAKKILSRVEAMCAEKADKIIQVLLGSGLH